MENIREIAECKSLRLFLWNEKLTRNQVSQSEGLCVFIIRSSFTKVQPCECGMVCSEYWYQIEDKKCSSVIPFNLSKLQNKEASLGSMLVSATLQFLPQTIKHLGGDISLRLFTKFQDSQALLPPPRPTYVVAIEIFQTRYINFTNLIDHNISSTGYPPDIPLYRRFENEDEENEVVFSQLYTKDVIAYLDVLREYTSEGGISPMKPPIAVDVARGFVEVKPCDGSWCQIPFNGLTDLKDEICPVCHEEFTDVNEVITAYCSHAFHTRCLLPWLSKNNSCPTCRARYPLHYSPLLDHQRRKRKYNMLEANV
ncbi:hypothetical protein P3S68_028539 [Capsicum galapagoense]